MGLLSAAVPAQAQQKLAYLDSRRILAEAPGAEQARNQIQQEMTRFEQQVQVLRDSLQKVVEEYQARSLMMSPDARRQEEQRIAARQNELQARAQRLEVEANNRQNQLMQPVMDRVEKAIDDIRREGGYAIIFDAASAAMVSADTTLDLTTQVIARLRATAGASSSAPRSPSTPAPASRQREPTALRDES
jgi:outer membrane protein